ncbi:hypothetical protein DPMN_091394 [Dreissena polymorpha]|uniref:C2H2-type domain-containing protein n=1 Tax=Dreissena polymorpha TaxID=45954 RepID=A0A9D4L0G6_DREPO|nr:hypothetical protein DPMN_091394 [Dreissena polymorpha]
MCAILSNGVKGRHESGIIVDSITQGFRRFCCPVCAKLFFSLSNIDSHIRMHTGDKPFQCNICSYKSTQKGNLRRHRMAVHNLAE